MRTTLLILAAVCVAATAFAQPAAPAFLIERIEIAGVEHVSAGVIVSESLLTAGRAYSEQQLREANDRLRRLPFVLDATFALQKGSERDRYVLVVSVVEAKPLFYLLDLVFFSRSNDETGVGSSNDAILGARFFAGARSAFHFGVYARDSQRPFTRNFALAQAGYTRYDVFGTGALVTVAVNHMLSPQNANRLLPEALVAVPLSSNQTVTVAYTETATSMLHERVLESRWSYNTTNDPFFPTRGTVVSVGPVASYFDGITRPVGAPEQTVHRNALGLELEVRRHWELTALTSLGGEVLGGAVRIDQTRGGVPSDFTQGYGEAVLRLSRALSADPRSSSRLELTVRTFVNSSVRVELDSNEGTELSLSWARRNSWGTLRFGAGYAW